VDKMNVIALGLINATDAMHNNQGPQNFVSCVEKNEWVGLDLLRMPNGAVLCNFLALKDVVRNKLHVSLQTVPCRYFNQQHGPQNKQT
jgi:hypothetical protein